VRRGTRLLSYAALSITPLALAACGGRVPPAQGFAGRAAATTSTSAPLPSPMTTTTASGTATTTLPTLPSAGGSPSVSTPVLHPPHSSTVDPTQQAVLTAYETYLVDLSALDDTLNESAVAPLASVTTYRLAQASVRQAAAILSAHEHGIGTLRDDHVTVVMTRPASAALTDCQDEDDFYLAEASGTPDPFVARGDFAGSAQLVLQNGQWLVDVFTTTHLTCAY
jgi:hypothetical protein